MKNKTFVLLIALCALTAPAHAENTLPIKTGFYVPTDENCADAVVKEPDGQYASITESALTYDGRSMNGSESVCKTLDVKQDGNTYQFKNKCRDESDSESVNETTYIVNSDTSFSVRFYSEYNKKTTTQDYKWCNGFKE